MNNKTIVLDASSLRKSYTKLQKDIGGQLIDNRLIGKTSLGDVNLEYFSLIPSVNISVNQVFLQNNVQVSTGVKAEKSSLFITILKKNSRFLIDSETEHETELSNGNAQYSIMLYKSSHSILIDFKKDEDIKWVGIRVEHEALEEIMEAQNSSSFSDFFKELKNKVYYEETNPEVEDITEELFAAQKLTMGRQAIVFGKGMELMGKLVSQLIEKNKRRKTPEKIISKEAFDIYFNIKDYLLSDYTNIPTIAMLSDKFKIGETKLKEDFKQIFGQPIFKFVTNHRMLDAHRALRYSEKPIGKIAKEVGYSHLSKFTTAFKRFYDYTPSELRNSKKIQSH
ncbi:AraC family transcriptional regulator [Flammeovirga pectinis]|uniref:AraC family transcriptional regulator n=1 Tax=Flammeovirga pectinis TaxID=2494373 RepID=A0A3Q9FM35_9BACT|nr:AraC family transcriptional regulator [Flammeovirga pectinis]AZQ62838.1 AraC family transcriptional regulator [Flammeovirga pectinis]